MKVVILGDAGVGKTSILNAELGTSIKDVEPTIGNDQTDLKVTTDSGQVDLCIWDTAGQEVYQSLAPCYSQKSKAQIFVFSVDDDLTFRNLKSWVEMIEDEVDQKNYFVVGNKVDLPNEKRQVSFDEGLNFAESINAPYSEVSAVTKSGISELFKQVAQILSSKYKDEEKKDQTVELKDEKSQEQKRHLFKRC